jgi:hypothetical protein
VRLGDEFVHRIGRGDIMDDIIAFNGIAGYYLTVSNLYLWYYDHRSAPV